MRWSDWDGAHHTNWQDPAVVLGEAKRGHRGHQSIQRHTLLIYGCRQPAWLRVHFQQHRERYRDTQRRDLLLLAQRLDPQYIPGKRRAPWRSTHAVILARAALAAGGGASSGHPSQDLGSSSLRRSSLVLTDCFYRTSSRQDEMRQFRTRRELFRTRRFVFPRPAAPSSLSHFQPYPAWRFRIKIEIRFRHQGPGWAPLPGWAPEQTSLWGRKGKIDCGGGKVR